MDFRLKCIMQTLFGLLPGSEGLNYFAQKHLTRNLPPGRAHYEQIRECALQHHGLFIKHGICENAVVYEVGCGWHMGMALTFSRLGYKKVIALDTQFHVRKELLSVITGYMKEDGLLDADMPEFDASCDIKEKLLHDFNIIYLAPCDSAGTGLDSSSIDCIYSHLVFEHIPPALLPAVLSECRRVLKSGGVMSLTIDYMDHYRTFDNSITPYNFLKYSEKSWKKYNPELHYVNRLRHKDFIGMFLEAGFEIAEENAVVPDNAQEVLSSITISDEFTSKYTRDELSVTNSHVVLRKN